MPPPRKRRKVLPQQKGKKRQYLEDNFGILPDNPADLKCGHVYLVYINHDKSPSKTGTVIMEKYSCHSIQRQLKQLLNCMKKFSDTTSESVILRFKSACNDEFSLEIGPEGSQCQPNPAGPSLCKYLSIYLSINLSYLYYLHYLSLLYLSVCKIKMRLVNFITLFILCNSLLNLSLFFRFSAKYIRCSPLAQHTK